MSKSEFVPESVRPFEETNCKDVRNSEGLVWWRPDGVLSETPDNDKALVRIG